MPSMRTFCPECHGQGANVVDLADLLYSADADYFRCRACGCWWMVPKHADASATPVVLGNPNASVIVKRAS
jgi:hypothetical protein